LFCGVVVSIEWLKRWRFWVPPLFIIFGAALLGWLTNEWEIKLPNSFEDMTKMWPAAAVGFLYYLTPLRKLSNASHHKEVSNNIVFGLLKIADLSPSEHHTWRNIKGIFYDFVDNDESLKNQSKLIYENGLFWTSAADLRIVSGVYSIIAVAMGVVFKSDGWFQGLLCFLALFLISWSASQILTRRHLELGNEQLKQIERKYSDQLKTELGKIS
jgi:hypothetical protein